MPVTGNATVRDIAASSLAAVRVFERLGIDYCCGGKRSLANVCGEKGFEMAAVLQELSDAMADAPAVESDWKDAPLTALVEHIVSTHHSYLRRELPGIEARLEKVYRVYNERYGPTLPGLPAVFTGLKEELEAHLAKEETVLFPVIAAYEAAIAAGRPLPPVPFGSVSRPVHMMESEHEGAGRALAMIRNITRNYDVPEFACVTYRALMSSLAELERDLHVHIHLENNILFPRAEQLERERE